MKENNVVTSTNKPQIGSKIRCINTGGYDFLSSGKIYDVKDADSDGFTYTDDDGDGMYYLFDSATSESFELVEEGDKMKDTSGVQDEFQVGDVVWCILRGRGSVTCVADKNEGKTRPVEVCFGSSFSWYTYDGKPNSEHSRTLFFSEPKIEAAVTRPFVPTLIGKKVVVESQSLGLLMACTVTGETRAKVNVIDGRGDNYRWQKVGISAIYEVSSENLLKK